MNSNLDEYLAQVIAANSKALEAENGSISIAEALPCLVCRELEVPSNDFVDSSDPFLMSYRALRRIQRLDRPTIPRKIEFGSAVYLKEGVIDCIFPTSFPVAPVNLIFIGDGNSDKRFAYNTQRLFGTLNRPFRSRCFIANPALLDAEPRAPFGGKQIQAGWDAKKQFYHARSWNELSNLEGFVGGRKGGQTILIVDLDGTLFCPRPKHYEQIQAARSRAIVELCGEIFDRAFFNRKRKDVDKLRASYADAAKTGFSRAYDDEDLTMLIALGLFAGIIDKNDLLLNQADNVGFVTPVEWLQYAAFVIENNPEYESRCRQLRALYVRCTTAIQSGMPSAFLEFRKTEERVLVDAAKKGEIVLNRRLLEFIRDSARKGAVPIGFSDRPNACLGLTTKPGLAYTASASKDSLFHTPLRIA